MTMDRGPRTGVIEGVSLSDLDVVEGGGPPALSAPCRSQKLTEESPFTLQPPFLSSFFVAMFVS